MDAFQAFLIQRLQIPELISVEHRCKALSKTDEVAGTTWEGCRGKVHSGYAIPPNKPVMCLLLLTCGYRELLCNECDLDPHFEVCQRQDNDAQSIQAEASGAVTVPEFLVPEQGDHMPVDV